MVTLKTGNLLEAEVEALVNTVNTEGIMGKGVALQFKKAFPEMFESYRKACKAGQVQPGKMHVFVRGALFKPRYIFNFPTKRHWRAKARMEDIEAGLNALVAEVKERGIKSIALPPLGCGLGGLRWEDVLPRIKTAFASLPDLDVRVYPPQAAPIAEKMVNRTIRPKMTLSRANVLHVLSRYCVLGYELTLLEVHKLLYFLQEIGEPLRLRFEKSTYGPYADNLRHVLHSFEGHFTQGFADGLDQPDTSIKLLPDALEEAEALITSQRDEHIESEARLEHVAALIEGFESPYGMELLATVHWVATHDLRPARDEDGAIKAVHAWNDRKRGMMKPEHIRVAWRRLQSEGWLV